MPKVCNQTDTSEVLELETQSENKIYCANCINEEESAFKGGFPQKKRCAVCLETQHSPDAPNHSEFASTELNPGELYDYTTVFKFEN